MPFPADRIPDGAAVSTHHLVWGCLLALVGVLVVWDDDRDREPLLALLGLLGAEVGFLLAWRFHPVVGATLSLVGPVLAIGAVSSSSRRRAPPRSRAVVRSGDRRSWTAEHLRSGVGAVLADAPGDAGGCRFGAHPPAAGGANAVRAAPRSATRFDSPHAAGTRFLFK